MDRGTPDSAVTAWGLAVGGLFVTGSGRAVIAKAIDARLTVATLEDGTICAMQKGGDSPLTFEDIDKMVGIAIDKGKELRKIFNKVK